MHLDWSQSVNFASVSVVGSVRRERQMKLRQQQWVSNVGLLRMVANGYFIYIISLKFCILVRVLLLC